MFRSYAGIIESRRDRMRSLDLTVFVLQHEAFGPMQHPDPAARERSRMITASKAASRGFNTDHAYGAILHERMKEPHRVGSAADARQQNLRQTSFNLQNLFARFPADHGLEISDHRGIGMRADDRSDDVMRRPDVRHPVAHRFVDRVFERFRAAL